MAWNFVNVGVWNGNLSVQIAANGEKLSLSVIFAARTLKPRNVGARNNINTYCVKNCFTTKCRCLFIACAPILSMWCRSQLNMKTHLSKCFASCCTYVVYYWSLVSVEQSGEQLRDRDSCSEDDEHEQQREATSYHQLPDRQSRMLWYLLTCIEGFQLPLHWTQRTGPTGLYRGLILTGVQGWEEKEFKLWNNSCTQVAVGKITCGYPRFLSQRTFSSLCCWLLLLPEPVQRYLTQLHYLFPHLKRRKNRLRYWLTHCPHIRTVN